MAGDSTSHRTHQRAATVSSCRRSMEVCPAALPRTDGVFCASCGLCLQTPSGATVEEAEGARRPPAVHFVRITQRVIRDQRTQSPTIPPKKLVNAPKGRLLIRQQQQQIPQIVSAPSLPNPHSDAQFEPSNGPVSVSLRQQEAAGQQLHPSIQSSSGSSSRAAAAAPVLCVTITSSSCCCRCGNSAAGRHCALSQQKCSSAQRQAPTKRPNPGCLGDSSQARPAWGAVACSGSGQAQVCTLCHGRPGWCAGGLGECRLCQGWGGFGDCICKQLAWPARFEHSAPI